jgi:23S rRNA (guanosine2251-2'-O)-methyltransferase
MDKNNRIYGAKLILEYIKSGGSISKIWLAKSLNALTQEIEELARKHKIPVNKVERKELDKISDEYKGKSVIAEVSPITLYDEKFLLEQGGDRTYIFAVNIEDPQNLGAMLRSVHAFSADGLIVSNRNTTTITDSVIRASAGAVFNTKVIRVGNISNTLKKLKENQYWVYGTDVKSENSEEIRKVKFDKRSVILLGNEGKGLGPILKKACDFMVHIPCAFNSLNVSVATGIILSSVYEQRKDQ